MSGTNPNPGNASIEQKKPTAEPLRRKKQGEKERQHAKSN